VSFEDEMRDEDEFDEQGTALEPDPDAAEPDLFYGSVDEFVREYLIKIYRRPVGAQNGSKWAARYWEYPEALSRLDALWRAWEHLRLDPATGMSAWWRDHADHHMPVLLSPSGPFAASDDQNKRGEPLPYEAPDPDLFPDLRRGDE